VENCQITLYNLFPSARINLEAGWQRVVMAKDDDLDRGKKDEMIVTLPKKMDNPMALTFWTWVA
jgi:hypothetical protein